MTSTEILIIMFGGLTLFLLAGLPVAFVLGGLSVLFTVVFWDSSALVVLVLQMFDTMHSEALLGIPLYIFMACCCSARTSFAIFIRRWSSGSAEFAADLRSARWSSAW